MAGTVPPRTLSPGEPGYDPANPNRFVNLSSEDWARFQQDLAATPPINSGNLGTVRLSGTPGGRGNQLQITAPDPSTPPASRPSIPRANPPPPSPADDPPPDPPQSRAELVARIEKHRRPRCYVKVNGQKTFIPTEAEVVNNNYYAADTFRIVCSLTSLSAEVPPSFWASVAPIQLEVFFGFITPGASTPGWQSQIIGNVDDVEMDDEKLELILTGRDRTAELIETKTSEKFQNLTASQVAQQIAARHPGLVCDTIATTTKVGTYFHGDHARLNDERSEWDILTFLAEQEGFDVWVEGNILHFKPSEQSSQKLYRINYVPHQQGKPHAATLTGLNLRRSLLVARDVIVVVRSFNSRTGKSIEVTRKSTKRRGAHSGHSVGPSGGQQKYTFRVAGLTQLQAEAFADKKLKEITLHERIVDGFGPGDLIVKPRMKVRLGNTNTDFDQDYYCDAVERRMSQREGFTMRLRLKNHTPESTV